jgi:hypothetical protein
MSGATSTITRFRTGQDPNALSALVHHIPLLLIVGQPISRWPLQLPVTSQPFGAGGAELPFRLLIASFQKLAQIQWFCARMCRQKTVQI